MSKNYRVLFSYPDGHVEEIEEIFSSLEAAKQYGNDMMNQVAATERFHSNKGGLFGKKPGKPYYTVVEFDKEVSSLIFDSRKK